MVEVKNFDEAFNTPFEHLTPYIEAERAKQGAERRSEEEMVKQSIQNYAERVAPASPSVSPQSVPSVSTNTASPLPNYFSASEVTDEVRREVSRLVASVFSEGLEKTINESRKHSAFVQDVFHDALVDKLMPELKRRGML